MDKREGNITKLFHKHIAELRHNAKQSEDYNPQKIIGVLNWNRDMSGTMNKNDINKLFVSLNNKNTNVERNDNG